MKSRFYGRRKGRNLKTLKRMISFAMSFAELGLTVIVAVVTKRIENNVVEVIR